MKSMNRPIIAGLTALALGVALCCAGCSKKNAAKPVDTKPFEAAIADYLQSNSFGMKIASVQSIDQKGDTATAVCKMQEAEGTYALTVTWEFSFRRSNGHWQVERHTAK
jgi:PBP1b-binding outer membrane lipoprotein LpoB